MLSAQDFKGVYGILPTPAKEGADRWDATDTVDLDETARLTEQLIADGCSGLLALGHDRGVRDPDRGRVRSLHRLFPVDGEQTGARLRRCHHSGHARNRAAHEVSARPWCRRHDARAFRCGSRAVRSRRSSSTPRSLRRSPTWRSWSTPTRTPSAFRFLLRSGVRSREAAPTVTSAKFANPATYLECLAASKQQGQLPADRLDGAHVRSAGTGRHDRAVGDRRIAWGRSPVSR